MRGGRHWRSAEDGRGRLGEGTEGGKVDDKVVENGLSRKELLRRGGLLAASVGVLGAGASPALAGRSRKSAGNIEIWHWQSQNAYETIFKQVADRFKAKTGGDAKLSSVDYASYFAKFKTTVAGGAPPDLMEMSWTGDYRDLIDAGALLPLDDALKTGFPKFYKPVMDSLRYKGKIYGVPMDLNTLTIAYNKKIFAELGLTPPKTLNDLLAYAAKIRAKNYQPLASNLKDGWPGGDLWFAQVAYTDPSGTAIRKAELKQIKWTDPRFLKASQNIQQMLDAKLFADGSESLDFFGNINLFARGRTAMTYPHGNFSTGIIAKSVGKRFAWDLFPFPPLTAKGKAVATGGPAIIWSVPAKAANPEAAIEYMRMTTDATANKELVKQNYIPSSPADISSNPSAIYKRMVSFQPTAQTRAIFVPAVYTELLNAIQGLVAGDVTPRGVGSAMQKASVK
jgi:raffinose/stachyose/melibiose transport system substrate-binding protein